MNNEMFGLIVLIYVVVSILCGLSAVANIAWKARQVGLNQTSKETLDLPYGEENGSTFISMFFFPFFLTAILWPLFGMGWLASKVFKKK